MFDKVSAPVRSSAKQRRARTDKHANADKQGTQYVGDYFAASQYGGNAGGHSNTIITLPNSEGSVSSLLKAVSQAVVRQPRAAGPSKEDHAGAGASNADPDQASGADDA